ncbi:ROK family transcriptional regulator [Lacticaseibacillus parakribbianus]|uniref:ROK family transcriptional regulator n=1 Tax=Lacticaseibacillus parakribbianus TaxID=2970927 RepID=UPI0021CB7FF5|nr:ROK family transcriptional regulator [Lacticaseibacillus parakribbianus]
MQEVKSRVQAENEQRILLEVFNRKLTSRSQIASASGINKATVSALVADLLAAGLLRERGQGQSTQLGGRRPTLLTINWDLGYVVSVGWGKTTLDLLFARLNGAVLTTAQFPISGMAATAVLELIVAQIAAYPRHQRLLGIVVAVPAVVDRERSVATGFPGLAALDPVGALATRFRVPVSLHAAADLAAIYVRDFQRRGAGEDLVCLSTTDAVAAGIIIGGELYTGYRHTAGAVGTLARPRGAAAGRTGGTTNRSGEASARPGGTADASGEASARPGGTADASGEVLARPGRAANQPGEGCPGPLVGQPVTSELALRQAVAQSLGDGPYTTAAIAQLATARNPVVTALVGDFCRGLAAVIFNLATVLGPARIVVNSPLVAAMPRLLGELRNLLPTAIRTTVTLTAVTGVDHCELLGGCSVMAHALLGVADNRLAMGATVAQDTQ